MDNEVSSTSMRPASWREFLASALPGIVAGIGFLWLFSDQGLLQRLVQALLGGVVFSGFAMFAVFFCDHFVARLAGKPNREFDVRDSTVRGACALVILVWFLGVSWTRTNEEKMFGCLNDRADLADYSHARWSTRDVVDYCRDQLHQSYTYANDN